MKMAFQSKAPHHTVGKLEQEELVDMDGICTVHGRGQNKPCKRKKANEGRAICTYEVKK
jgi:hypothetical protein